MSPPFLRKNGKVGHLWQDRFKSFVVEKDGYLLESGRYIERNPLRARLVLDPREYVWSSYKVYAYGKTDKVTGRHELYEAMGQEEGIRKKAYQEYVCSNRDREEQEVRRKLRGGVLGSEGFQEKIERRIIENRRPKRGRPRK